MLRRKLIPNYKFIRNLSENQLIELIYINEGIPSRIMDFIQNVFHDIGDARLLASCDHEEFEDYDLNERKKTYNMNPFDADDYKNQNALDFLEKYPQFKGIVKEVEYYDDNTWKVIKREPLN